MKKRAGRPKGSKNKSRNNEKVTVGLVTAECVPNYTKLALNQVDQANAIKDLQMGMASLSQGLNNLVQNTNKVLGELANKITASEGRVSDVEKIVNKGHSAATGEGDSLT